MAATHARELALDTDLQPWIQGKLVQLNIEEVHL